MSNATYHRKLDALANELLSLIEIQESKLLLWGYIDVTSKLDEGIVGLINSLPLRFLESWEAFPEVDRDQSQILENLIERKLLFKNGSSYRSRFAETIRLLYLLRQLFPKQNWLDAPRLVSDLKIHLRRRSFPKRNISPGELVDDLNNIGLDGLRLSSVEALLKEVNNDRIYLAQFQRDSIFQIFRDISRSSDRGLVIGAGTGSGKTKAFYIPTLASIADDIDSASHTLKCLSIYPRIELLRDQFAEVFSETLKIDPILIENGKRLITVGTYYGDTPVSPKHILKGWSNWEKSQTMDGWICPYLSCPNQNCSNGKLVWRKDYIQRELAENDSGKYGQFTSLVCDKCGYEIRSEKIRLTRDELRAFPPDLLFTTTEMLNRRLGRPSEFSTFGICCDKPPRFLLLDEIHTYEGIHGAQIAYLIRRWRYARGNYPRRNLCVVGLSATLAQADIFFSRLTGLQHYQIEHLEPNQSDLVEEGMEYNIVIKGDPVSTTSLLSTSVQTAMLVGRILDPYCNDPRGSLSRGTFGHKIFAFSDNLDVINRWYHIETDAETRQVLSSLRDPDKVDNEEDLVLKDQAGQLWKISKDIGHDLDTPLILDITSSQNRGLNKSAQLVIASSTLEVGFDDHHVGAIIQHKAPRTSASFLQRKGRAGRIREMRPWTLVITSDYGRDRWAFQHSESLFEPIVPPIELPLENYYVQKIQGAYLVLDWVARKFGETGIILDIWRLFTCDEKSDSTEMRKARQEAVSLLEAVLEGSLRLDFEKALSSALQTTECDLHQILWGEPRPLLLEVIPSLIRQLGSDWQEVRDGSFIKWKDSSEKRPLPGYLPSSLFSDLNLPEAKIELPRDNRQKSSTGKQLDNETQYLPLTHAISEFSPGHVSKRYARSYRTKEAHWLALPDEAQMTRGVIPLENLRIIFDQDITALDSRDGASIQVLRPRIYALDLTPEYLKPTSKSKLHWQANFQPINYSSEYDDDQTPANSHPFKFLNSWSANSILINTFTDIEVFSHTFGSMLDITRLSPEIEVDLRFEDGRSKRETYRFENEGNRSALGFKISVDAMRFVFRPIDIKVLMSNPLWGELKASLIPELFAYKLRHDIRLAESGLTKFDIERLWQLELSMLNAVAISRRVSLKEAANEVDENRLAYAERTLDVIFQSLTTEDNDEDSNDRRGRLHKLVMSQFGDSHIVEAIRENRSVLWDDQKRDWEDWLPKVYSSSIGSVLYTSILEILNIPENVDLIMDVTEDSVWISETTPGGIGYINRIARIIAQEPRKFTHHVMDVIQHCDRGFLAGQLDSLADLILQSNGELAEIFKRIRSDTELPNQVETFNRLRTILEHMGIQPTRELIVAINSKYLRLNSGPDSDKLIGELVNIWKDEEKRLGCSIDLRVISVASLRLDRIKNLTGKILDRIGGKEIEVSDTQRFNLLQSLLWLRCINSCKECIEHWHPYCEFEMPSRRLLELLFEQNIESIQFGSDQWIENATSQLTHNFTARIICHQDELEICKVSILKLILDPIEIGYQFFHPNIEKVSSRNGNWVIDLVIREITS